jgi:endonuclease/exonuclease/phosphatase family metal-dependent hydrolase
MPVVLVGDFNAAPGGDTYQQILAAGYQDAWSATGDPGDPGYTCCFPPALRGGDRVPDQRIDLVFVSSDVEPLSAEVLGEDPGDLTGSSLRPSDHAGLAATLRVGVSP